jgi:ADP-heptose:LPS heptosyltransferase
MEIVTYIGMGNRGHVIDVPDASNGHRTYRFEIMKPRPVPGDFARKLAEKPFFLLGDDSPFKEAVERLPMGSRIAFHRFGALGDLLMLNAVLRPLRRAFPGYIFELHARVNAKEIFRYEPTYGAIRTYQLVDDDPADAIIPLDGVLEVDHSSSEVDQHHRVDLFRRFLLKGFDPMPKLKLDWTLPISGIEEKFGDDWMAANIPNRNPNRPVVALQTHGSGPMKTLDPDVVKKLAERLSHDYEVVLIGQDAQFFDLTNLDHIHHPRGRILEIFAILKRCDALVTMDSGILWLGGHNAALPTVCILGPTREKERLTCHPLYEDGKVVSINMAKAIDCPPCFEHALRCRWKYTCMRGQARFVIKEVRSALQRILP